MKRYIQTTLLLTGFLFLSLQLFSQLSLPAIFTDNMVLQQKTDAPIWGKALPNSTVKIVNGKQPLPPRQPVGPIRSRFLRPTVSRSTM